jgi:hypothetical protein
MARVAVEEEVKMHPAMLEALANEVVRERSADGPAPAWSRARGRSAGSLRTLLLGESRRECESPKRGIGGMLAAG